MAQHLLKEDTQADRQALRRLGMVIGGFVVATIIMAVTVGLIMG